MAMITLVTVYILEYMCQGLSQDLETGCPKLVALGIQISKGDSNVLRFQP